jgi:hypothetical protein
MNRTIGALASAALLSACAHPSFYIFVSQPQQRPRRWLTEWAALQQAAIYRYWAARATRLGGGIKAAPESILRRIVRFGR